MGKKPRNVKIEQAQSSAELAPIRQTALQDLQRQAAGKGPSISQEQLKAAQERTLAQQLAAAQARPTRNVGALQRQLVQEQGAAGRQLAQVGALAKAQEQLGAQDKLLGLTESDLARVSGVNQANAQLAAQRQQAISQQQTGIIGGLIGAAGSIGASALAPAELVSDERAKENKTPAKQEIKSFLDALSAQKYNYKAGPKDKKFGIMAQDLEKSEAGKSMVKEVEGVKTVDMASGFGTILAAQAELNKRLSKLESKKKRD